MAAITSSFLKWLLSTIGVFTILFNLSAELNKTHVWNELFDPHARFHIVWQLTHMSLITCVTLILLWGETIKTNTAALLLSLEPIGFCVASASISTYGGSFFPANVPEYDIQILGIPIALLYFACTGALFLIVCIIYVNDNNLALKHR